MAEPMWDNALTVYTVARLDEAARTALAWVDSETVGGTIIYGPDATTAPGKLRLVYTDGLHLHTISARFTQLGNPFNHSQNNTDALNWAAYLMNCISSSLTVVGWESFDYLNHLVDGLFFPVPVDGTRSPVTGDVNAISFSLRLSGHGILTDSASLAGDTSCKFFPMHGWTCALGERYIAVQDDLDLYNMAGFLVTHPRLWADKTSRKAGMRGEVGVQFNAAIQNRWGR